MVPGFELTTFGHESPPITTRPGLPPIKHSSYKVALLLMVSFIDASGS